MKYTISADIEKYKKKNDFNTNNPMSEIAKKLANNEQRRIIKELSSFITKELYDNYLDGFYFSDEEVGEIICKYFNLECSDE